LEREQLGASLRQLRIEAGLTGEKLARLLSVSQSKVSRIETGSTLPAPDDITAWVMATGASEQVRDDMLARRESIATEVGTWRVLHRAGLRRAQENIYQRQAPARSIQTFQPVMVPGLLQTADYARRVMLQGNPSGQADIAEAVSARMQRQQVLYDQTKQFEFIVTEHAIRWRPGPAQMLPAQLGHLMTMATLPNLKLGVIPEGIEAPLPYLHPFILHEYEEDDPLVIVETYTAELQVRDARDVELYRSYLRRLRSVARWQQGAISLIRTIASEVSKHMES
jgi:transcriptional regulator with XRE-family HTH domain